MSTREALRQAGFVVHGAFVLVVGRPGRVPDRMKVAVILALLLAGCGLDHGSSSPDSGTQDGGPGPDGNVSTRAGVVSIGTTNTATGLRSYVAAYFGAGSVASLRLGDVEPGCDVTTLTSDCVELRCSSALPTDSAGAMQASWDGVTLPIAVQPAPIGTVRTPLYYGWTPMPLPVAGDPVVVAAAGDVVPAFSAMIALPPDSDAVDLATNLTLSRGLVVSWPPVAADASRLVLDAPGHQVICGWSGVPGPLTTIPPLVVSRFSVGEFVVVSVEWLNTTTTVAGRYMVGVEALRGASFSATVMP